MKLLIRKLGAGLQRLSPLANTALGLGALLTLGAIDCFTPAAMSFVLFYMLVVVLVGWGAGKWHALLIAAVAGITITTVQWFMHRGVPQNGWIALWNNSTYFLVFSLAGWLTAEVTRLTRHLGRLVEERTAQWKVEVEQHQATSTRLREAHDGLELRVGERTADLQAANTALRDSEARLRLVLDASGAGTWSWDVAADQSAWDDRCHELFGLEPQAPRSYESWVRRVHPADRERLLARLQTVLEPGGGEVWNEEFRVLHPVKGERWMAGLGRVERDQAGRAVRLAGIPVSLLFNCKGCCRIAPRPRACS